MSASIGSPAPMRRAASARPAVSARPAAEAPLLDARFVARWLPAVVLTILDAALTYTWLAAGIAAEANPWLASLVETAGPGSAMAVRAGIGIALVGALAVLSHRHVAARRGLALVTGVLGLVLCWHVAGGAIVALSL